MMKKLLILALGCAALALLAAPVAQAASYTFFAQVGYETPAAEGSVWLRYYTPTDSKINPSGEFDCKGTWDPPFCEVPHTNKPDKNKVGYLGYLDDVFNYQGQLGVQYMALWDTEFGSGSTDHRGYYAWMAMTVDGDETSKSWTAGCAGSKTGACLGSAEPDNAAGTDVENTPLGTIAPHGGLRPIPVPLPTGVDGDTIHLSWNAVTSISEDVAPEYYLYYVVRDADCTAPTADEYDDAHRLGPYSGTTADVTTAELGFDQNDQKGVFFALRIKYPSLANGDEMLSKYLSANSQCIVFGAFAAEVVNIEAKWLRRNQVQVSWETQLEDGVKGFYVLRSFTPDGPFERVSDLVAANGEPSKYTYIDNVTVNGRVAASGLYYKIEAVDYDEGQKVFGPAQADLPVGGQRKIKTRKGFRF